MMILLTAVKMPKSIRKSALEEIVKAVFPNPENQEYISEIVSRASDDAALESLFALSLLYEQIMSLPYPGICTQDLIFSRNENGKPYFVNSDIKFNISHSKGYVAVAVSRGEELGVDVEASDVSREKAEKLAKRYFNEIETEAVNKDCEAFAKIWSEKEAKAKFSDKSIGNILLQEKNCTNIDNISNIRVHNFSYGKIPITLCTKREFSTISFTVQ